MDDWRDRVQLSSFFVGSWRPDGWEVPRPRGNTKRAEGHPVFSGAGWLNNEVSAGMVAGEGGLELSGGFWFVRFPAAAWVLTVVSAASNCSHTRECSRESEIVTGSGGV